MSAESVDGVVAPAVRVEVAELLAVEQAASCAIAGCSRQAVPGVEVRGEVLMRLQATGDGA